jgi:hypothetical protein
VILVVQRHVPGDRTETEWLMLRRHRRQEDDRHHPGTLEVFDIRVVDEPRPSPSPASPSPPSRGAPAPLACRWHLWHQWAAVRVDAHTTYVACAGCGRLPTPTVFEPPAP